MSGETNFGDSGAAYLERLEQDRADLIAALDRANICMSMLITNKKPCQMDSATLEENRALLARLEGRER